MQAVTKSNSTQPSLLATRADAGSICYPFGRQHLTTCCCTQVLVTQQARCLSKCSQFPHPKQRNSPSQLTVASLLVLVGKKKDAWKAAHVSWQINQGSMGKALAALRGMWHIQAGMRQCMVISQEFRFSDATSQPHTHHAHPHQSKPEPHKRNMRRALTQRNAQQEPQLHKFMCRAQHARCNCKKLQSCVPLALTNLPGQSSGNMNMTFARLSGDHPNNVGPSCSLGNARLHSSNCRRYPDYVKTPACASKHTPEHHMSPPQRRLGCG